MAINVNDTESNEIELKKTQEMPEDGNHDMKEEHKIIVNAKTFHTLMQGIKYAKNDLQDQVLAGETRKVLRQHLKAMYADAKAFYANEIPQPKILTPVEFSPELFDCFMTNYEYAIRVLNDKETANLFRRALRKMLLCQGLHFDRKSWGLHIWHMNNDNKVNPEGVSRWFKRGFKKKDAEESAE